MWGLLSDYAFGHGNEAGKASVFTRELLLAVGLVQEYEGSDWVTDDLQSLFGNGYYAKREKNGLPPFENKSRSGNVWDNAAMESFFSSLKTERTARKTYRMRDEAKADVFDYIERFYNAKRRHSTIGYKSPMEFEMQAGLA